MWRLCALLQSWVETDFFFYVAVDFDFKVTDCLRLTVFVFVEKKKKDLFTAGTMTESSL